MSVTDSTLMAIEYQALHQSLPPKPLFAPRQGQTADATGWLLSPEPYLLTPAQTQFLHSLGQTLWQFSKAIETLYKQSQLNPQWLWIKQLFEANKPEGLLQYAAMKRFKSQMPLVIRPDLLVTQQGFALCEIDAVPGGLGFTSALARAYQANGVAVLGAAEGMVEAFVALLKSVTPHLDHPIMAVVVSDEAVDYRLEWEWLIETAQQVYPDIYLLHPKQLRLRDDRLGWVEESSGAFKAIDVVYRFFELFDLPNIPNLELIQFALKKGWVACTPPFKPHLEEKLVLGLLHYPYLEAFWEEQLSTAGFEQLKGLVPQTWLLNPDTVPASAAVIPQMTFGGQSFRTFQDLDGLTQTQRQLVIKPSGFSPLAWGSRGVVIGHDVPQSQWQTTLHQALGQYHQTPHLMQRYESPCTQPYRYYHPQTHEIIQAEGRTRLCPYYFVTEDQAQLAGVLATTCPKDKKVIHGMAQGVMRPAALSATSLV